MKKRLGKKLLWVLALLLLVLLISIPSFYFTSPIFTGYRPLPQESHDIILPSGFSLYTYAEVPGARSLALSEEGTLFVGTRSDKVYAIRDEDRDGKAERVTLLAENLQMPNGVALKDGDLYVAEVSRILRFNDIERTLNIPSPKNIPYEVLFDNYPKDTHHGWKFIRFGPDGLLYVPVGAPCNLCDEGDPYASITRLNADFTEYEVVQRGIRNTVGFDFHPQTDDIWFTDNGRDWFGDDYPPDELNHASEEGMHFGYPYCHGQGLADDEFTTRSCDEFTPAQVALGPHVASLGMRFYQGNQFPSKYREGIFIAEHGSWNRKEPIGYRITFVSAPNYDTYEVFASGWLKNGISSGRPVDIEEMPDGSILVSDDRAGKIYRISYGTQSADSSGFAVS